MSQNLGSVLIWFSGFVLWLMVGTNVGSAQALPQDGLSGSKVVLFSATDLLLGIDVALVAIATWVTYGISSKLGASHLSLGFYLFLALLVFCAVTSFGLLVAFLQSQQKPNDESKRERFLFTVGANVWIYDVTLDRTLFFMLAQIINRGTPSVVLGAEATYTIGNVSEPMKPFWLREPYTVQVGNEQLTVSNPDLLLAKVGETPIPSGGCANGRILMTLEGDRTAQVKATGFRIEIVCRDIDGNVYSATCAANHAA